MLSGIIKFLFRRLIGNLSEEQKRILIIRGEKLLTDVAGAYLEKRVIGIQKKVLW